MPVPQVAEERQRVAEQAPPRAARQEARLGVLVQAVLLPEEQQVPLGRECREWA